MKHAVLACYVNPVPSTLNFTHAFCLDLSMAKSEALVGTFKK